MMEPVRSGLGERSKRFWVSTEGSPRAVSRRANLVPAERAGVLFGWVTDISLPGSEKQPGRPVQPRAGGPRRSQRQRGPSLVRPDDGPWSGGPRPGGATCHPESPTESGESCCVPSPAAAGQAASGHRCSHPRPRVAAAARRRRGQERRGTCPQARGEPHAPRLRLQLVEGALFLRARAGRSPASRGGAAGGFDASLVAAPLR